jgi:hypothetical protein
MQDTGYERLRSGKKVRVWPAEKIKKHRIITSPHGIEKKQKGDAQV